MSTGLAPVPTLCYVGEQGVNIYTLFKNHCSIFSCTLSFLATKKEEYLSSVTHAYLTRAKNQPP